MSRARLGPRGRAVAALLALLLLAVLAAYAGLARRVTVDFALQAMTAGRLQVFHASDGAFSEYESQWLHAGAQRQPQRLDLAGDAARHLRLDPPAGRSWICGLRVAGQAVSGEPVHVQDVQVSREGDCLRLDVAATAADPQLVLRAEGDALQSLKQARRWQRVFVGALCLLALLAAAWAWRARAALDAFGGRLPAVPALARLDRHAGLLCAALMLAFGLGYALLTPPGAVADEEAHLAKVVRIAHGAPFGDSGTRPLPDPRGMYGPFRDYLVNKAPFTPAQLAAQRAQPLACEPVPGTRLAKGANGYFPHHYALPTLAYVAGCAGGASFGGFLLAARVLNLLLAAALVGWGVARAGRGKWALVLVALLPMSMFQMASLSADALMLGLCMAWLGLVSALAGGLPAARAGRALWLLSLAIALLKPGAAWVLAALVFTRPAFEDRRAFVRALLKFVLLPWAIHVAWTLSAAGEAPVLDGVDPKANLALLTAHPFAFPRLLWNAFTGGEGLMLFQRLVGVLGWLDVPLSAWAYTLATLAMFAAFWTHARQLPPRPVGHAPLAWALALGSTAVLALPLFLYWTPTGAAAVQGLQGRYFLPTLAFVLTLCGLRANDVVRAALVALVLVAAVALNIDALARLHEAYFVSGR